MNKTGPRLSASSELESMLFSSTAATVLFSCAHNDNINIQAERATAKNRFQYILVHVIHITHIHIYEYIPSPLLLLCCYIILLSIRWEHIALDWLVGWLAWFGSAGYYFFFVLRNFIPFSLAFSFGFLFINIVFVHQFPCDSRTLCWCYCCYVVHLSPCSTQPSHIFSLFDAHLSVNRNVMNTPHREPVHFGKNI